MENWKTVRLGDVCEKGSSNIAQNEITDNNGEYPIYGAAGFIKNVDFYKQDKPYIGIVKDGAGVGRVSVHPAKSSLIGTMQYIFPKENIDIKFLAEFLKYQNLSRFYTGATIPHIYFKDYQNIPLKLPSLQKQKHISAVLDKCTALITKHKLMLEKYDTLIKSRFIEMFGDNQTLEFQTLENICSIITDGTHQPPKFTTTGIPFLFVSNIAGNKITYETEKFISERTYEELYKRTPIEIGDVLLSTVGSYGHPAIVETDNKFLFQRHIAYLKPKKDFINSIYFHGALLSPDAQKQIEERVKGIAQKTLNLSKIRKIKIPVPPLSLQNDFATFVQQIDKSKFEIWRYLKFSDIMNKIGFRFYD